MNDRSPSGPRRQRDTSELEWLLREHLYLLAKNSAEYDRGEQIVALQMAVSLRALLNASEGDHLLEEFGFASLPWFDSAHLEIPADAIAVECSTLTMTVIRNGSAFVSPTLAAGGKHIAFTDWWSKPILRTLDSDESLDRRGAVIYVANFDGGHAARKKPSKYHAIETGTFFNARTFSGDEVLPVGGMSRALIRGIAHEVLLTVSRHRPDLVPVYRWRTLEMNLRGQDGFHENKFVDANASNYDPSNGLARS